VVLAGCGDLIVKALEAIGSAPVTEVRIAGSNFLTLSSHKDSADRLNADNGFLCVKHSPGCPIKGNDGLDDFFGVGKPLPLLAQIVGVDFMPASGPVPGDATGVGSFGTDLKTVSPDGQTATQVDWRNTCWGVAGGKDLYYRISFRIRVRGDGHHATASGADGFGPLGSRQVLQPHLPGCERHLGARRLMQSRAAWGEI